MDASKNRSEADFRSAEAALPDGHGWSACTFAKDSWSSESARAGTCKGIKSQSLSSLHAGEGFQRLQALEMHLRDMRKSCSKHMANMPLRVRSRISGPFDVLSSLVIGHVVAKAPMPEDPPKKLVLRCLADVRRLLDADLVLEGST